VAVEDVPGSYGDEDAVAPWEIYPAHTAFHLNGYPLQDTFFSAHIMIFPVGEFRSMSSQAGSVVDDLQQYLTYGSLTVGEHIPFFPLFNAAQFITAKIKKLSFQNGEGVRFVTLYTQSGPPINNNELFYAFQGITSDGSKYISAIFPLNHPNLSADSSLPDDMDWQEWALVAEDYVAD